MSLVPLVPADEAQLDLILDGLALAVPTAGGGFAFPVAAGFRSNPRAEPGAEPVVIEVPPSSSRNWRRPSAFDSPRHPSSPSTDRLR